MNPYGGAAYGNVKMRREEGSGAPQPMDWPQRSRVRAAAFRVQQLYPGPAGAVLAKELFAWEEFGYRFGNTSLISQLVDHVLGTALPTPE